MDGINMLIDELIEECMKDELMRDDNKQKLINEYASIRAQYNAGFITKREAAGMIAGYYAD